MNERIKLLAKTYLSHERFSRYGESIEEDYYEFYPEDLEKFAELIVRECAQLVEDNMDPQNAWITPGYVKQHFGVEERKDLVCPKCGVDRTLVDELQIECDRLYRIIELNGILK